MIVRDDVGRVVAAAKAEDGQDKPGHANSRDILLCPLQLCRIAAY